MPRKKVLFLITKATWGGAQKYVFDLATHLPQAHFDISVAYGQPGRLSQMLKENTIKTHLLPSLGRDVALVSDISSFFQVLNLLRADRPDVLHVNSSKAAALGALAARLCGVRKIIFTAHGWPFKEHRNAFARAAIHFISWFTTLCAHATIVVSKRDEEIGQHMWLVGKKIVYVPIGIMPVSFLSREEVATTLSLPTGVPRIVTIAELTANKGLRFAIDAIAELKARGITCAYFIMGEGELREELERHARERGVSEQVHFLGFVEQAARYLKAFDVFLLSSIKEGMPYVLLEATQAGVPVVSTNVIDPVFFESNPDAISVSPAHVFELANAVEHALKKHAHTRPHAPVFSSFGIEMTMHAYL